MSFFNPVVFRFIPSHWHWLATYTGIALATSTIAATATLGYYVTFVLYPRRELRRLLKNLPKDLQTWRLLSTNNVHDIEAYERTWLNFDKVFRKAGYTLSPRFIATQAHDGLRYENHIVSSGFGYTTVARESEMMVDANTLQNPLQHTALTYSGNPVLIRIIVLKDQGHSHLALLRKLSTGKNAYRNDNHCLPLLAEFQPSRSSLAAAAELGDMVFGIFPVVGAEVGVGEAYKSQRNSVGDVVEMILQMLEALEFIHSQSIAHCDAFSDNFVIQFHPESLLTKRITPSRPRVYLTNFEFAMQFADDCPAEERLITGYPSAYGSSTLRSVATDNTPIMYNRPVPEEVGSGKRIPYSPFQLDVWQLGTSFSDFKTTIAQIDHILLSFRAPELKDVPDSAEAFRRLSRVVCSLPPEWLLIEPGVVDQGAMV